MDIFVAPLEVVDNPFVSEFLLHNEQILEKISDSLVNVKVIELGDHSLLVFQILFVLVDQCVPFVNDGADVVECLRVKLRL